MIDFEQKAFFGVGFSNGNFPLDLLPIYQLGFCMPDFSLLIVDEFLKLNRECNESVDYNKEKLVKIFGDFSSLYGFSFPIIFCSDFMNSEEYMFIYASLCEKVESDKKILEKIINTIPEKRGSLNSSIDYPVHELACVKYLSEREYELKIGPSKEKQYDEIMKELEFEMNYAYVLDAYALGTKTADEVVHYIPESRGPNNGQRIFVNDNKRIIRQKLLQSCDTALKYFCKIASVSGCLLGREYLNVDDIERMHGKILKKITVKEVLNNIINPLEEVREND